MKQHHLSSRMVMDYGRAPKARKKPATKAARPLTTAQRLNAIAAAAGPTQRLHGLQDRAMYMDLATRAWEGLPRWKRAILSFFGEDALSHYEMKL